MECPLFGGFTVHTLTCWPLLQEYEQELYQLKDEFEKYKLRAQSVLKSRGGTMVCCTKRQT